MLTGNQQVSVIIPTYNRASALSVTLPSYLAETPREVIVVDDASTDETAAVVEAFSAKSSVPVHYIRHQKRSGAPAARNTGLEHASGEYILYGEDDVLLEEGYITVLLEDISAFHADIIAGRCIGMKFGEDKNEVMLRADRSREPLLDLENIEGYFDKKIDAPMAVPFVHALAIIRRDLAKEIRFDEGYRGNGYREETDFFIRAYARGAKIVFTPHAVCFHVSGSINKSGGQRMNRLCYEIWTVLNNTRFVYKNYMILRNACGWTQGPLIKSSSYAVFRLRRLLSRAARRVRASLLVV